MDNPAQYRLNEIIFCNLFKHLLGQNRNPIKAYNMIEILTTSVGGNLTIMNSVLTIILNNDRRYIADKPEYIAAMRACGVPVREICRRAEMSNTTYYKLKHETDDVVLTPKFSPAQYTEMMKLMWLFSDILDEMEGFDGYTVYKSNFNYVPTGI